MRVAIAEDSGLFRSSLALLLNSLGAEVTASVASGAELLAAIRAEPAGGGHPRHPDAAVVHRRGHPRPRRRSAASTPTIGILILSTYAESGYASQLLDTVRSGVGYLLKDNVTDVDALMESLARVAAGETVIDPAIVRQLLGRKRRAGRARHAERARDRRTAADGRGTVQPRASPGRCSSARERSKPTSPASSPSSG